MLNYCEICLCHHHHQQHHHPTNKARMFICHLFMVGCERKGANEGFQQRARSVSDGRNLLPAPTFPCWRSGGVMLSPLCAIVTTD
jgi:hypothetical protein